MSEIKVNSVVNSTGDNDSGLDLSTNDQVIIKTANTTAVTVNASQNVGIGTSSPASDAGLSKILQLGSSSDTSVTFVLKDDDGDFEIGSSGGSLRIYDDGLERARVDSSGNLLVGTTNSSVESSSTDEGVNIFANKIGVARDGGVTANFNRLTSDGDIIKFRKDGTEVGTISSHGSGADLGIGAGDTGLRIQPSADAIFPYNTVGDSGRDNAIDLGKSDNRFDDIYATNGTIQTSDRNEKQDIEELSDAEQRVAVVAKGLMRKFRWRDAVAEKGDNARTHFGIIAQDLQDAFTAEGLDAGDYAMFTSNTWWEKEISVDAVEADEENGIEAQDAYTYMDTKDEATEGYTERTRLGVRYNQLLAFIISAL